ncbi:hypothetical protein D9619_011955 [Psilocybe cf. subviscida]|uniref:Nephrocystin 3-like N-terminal domain-containing protein n=1 Tax=Psilocybe cf. subviscida TaxID=2480587 RepID=A0A8H5EW42_9AGAR|nr:hypothetical protein D9619_011955 [Psilocybe cf. subviscida]
MQTVAETFDKEGSLAISFFFSELSAKRPKEKENFVITMANQLSLCIPALQQPLADTLSDQSILTKSLTKQLDSLIINPLKALDAAQVGARCIVLVDGLDECDGDTAQRDVLDLLERLLDQAPHRVRILVASRSLSHIQSFFVRASIRERTQTTPLDNNYRSAEDIRQYFVSKFGGIQGEHPARSELPSEWPPRSDIDVLVERASGQFIYASVVMKFIAYHGRHPDESLQTIIRSKASGDARPYEELDTVYTQVLSTVEPQNLEFVYALMGCLILDKNEYCFAEVAQNQGTAQVDSLFMIPAGATRWHQILSSSFPEYLLDRSRSKEFFLDMPKVHCRLARIWFKSYSVHFKHDPRQGTTDSGAASYELQKNQSAFLYWELDVIAHCMEAEWTPELQQDMLAFDLQTALLFFRPPADLVINDDSYFHWVHAFRWVDFTFWLEQHHLQSTAHTEFLRGCNQSWLPVPQISPADRRVIAAMLTWYNHPGTLLYGDKLAMKEDSSLMAHADLVDAFVKFPAHLKDVRELLCIWLCQPLVPDAVMDNALFSNEGIYAEMVLRYMDDTWFLTPDILKVLCNASPAQELSTRLKAIFQKYQNANLIQIDFDKEFIDKEIANRGASSKENHINEEKETLLLICIYLFECGIPYISQHRHEPEFDPRRRVCSICLLFDPFKEECADIEISRDPPVKPDAVPAQIAEEPAPQFLQINQLRQLIPGIPLLWLQA